MDGTMRTDAIEEVTAMRRDVNDTLVFVRVVQEGSFTAAAHALQIPKTTVSRRVLELEKHVGAQLLRRTTRKLSVTEAGAIYYENCRGIAATLEHAEGEVHKLRDGPRGWLRLTMPYSFGVDWIAPLLPGFRARYPDVKIEIVASHATLDLVESEIDIALRLGELPDSSLVARRLASFPSGTFASPAYVKRAGLPQSPEQLCEHRTLTLHQARRDVGYVWPMRKGTGKPRGFLVHPVIVASDPFFLHPALLQGEGISLAMEMSMAADVKARRLVRVLSGWWGPPQELNALSSRAHLPSPKVQAFIAYMREQLRFPLAD
jgi:DNA-binding transcriptional LysR family regulator